MREKESGGPGIRQFLWKQLSVRWGYPGRVDEKYMDGKIHKHKLKQLLNILTTNCFVGLRIQTEIYFQSINPSRLRIIKE